MSIKFACDCGKAYKVPEKFSGKRVKCKQCGEPIRVPSESQTGIASTRASAVSKRSVLNSKRVSKRGAQQVSARTSRKSGRTSTKTASKETTSSRKSARTSARKSARTAARTSARARRAKPGGKTERFAAVNLDEGNELKRYQKKKEEEFSQGVARLTYFENGKAVKAFRVTKKEARIGRSDSCGVSLPLASVSDEHMKLEYKLGTFIATDLQSSNGMIVNGRSLRRSSLKSGDVIQLGAAILRFDC